MKPFGYCLNASTIRGTPVLRQIAVAADAGYGAIELWFSDTDAHGALPEIRRALDDAGLVVPTMIYFAGWFDCAESEWPRVKDAASRRLEQAAVLGAQHIICSPPEGKADVGIGARRYGELLELGRQFGPMPAFEFLGFVHQYHSIESALEVLNIAGGTTVLDPFHIFRGGGSVDSISKLQAAQIAISHFNDTVCTPPREKQGDADRVMPGDGGFDLARYCALLRGTGYRGWLSLELFREELWARDPAEVAREGLRKMKQIAEQ